VVTTRCSTTASPCRPHAAATAWYACSAPVALRAPVAAVADEDRARRPACLSVEEYRVGQ
jgi:hypothetical protein